MFWGARVVDVLSTLTTDGIYDIIAILLYSGVGSWLVARLARDPDGERIDRRIAIREQLELMKNLSEVRDNVPDAAKRQELDEMWARLLDEATLQIRELNALAEVEISNPKRRYNILPAPRSPFGYVVSALFVVAVYLSLGAALVLLLNTVRGGGIEAFTDPSDLKWAQGVVVFILATAAMAFLARFAAFRSYAIVTRRMREREAEALLASPESSEPTSAPGSAPGSAPAAGGAPPAG